MVKAGPKPRYCFFAPHDGVAGVGGPFCRRRGICIRAGLREVNRRRVPAVRVGALHLVVGRLPAVERPGQRGQFCRGRRLIAKRGAERAISAAVTSGGCSGPTRTMLLRSGRLARCCRGRSSSLCRRSRTCIRAARSASRSVLVKKPSLSGPVMPARRLPVVERAGEINTVRRLRSDGSGRPRRSGRRRPRVTRGGPRVKSWSAGQ